MASIVTGFEYRGTAFGGQSEPQRIVEYPIKDAAEILRRGDFANGEVVSGETQVDLAIAADTALIGAVNEYVEGGATAGGTIARVISNPAAWYAIHLGVAHTTGTTLKLGTGGTGQQTLVSATAGTDEQFIVVADNAANEPTIVRIASRAALMLPL